MHETFQINNSGWRLIIWRIQSLILMLLTITLILSQPEIVPIRVTV